MLFKNGDFSEFVLKNIITHIKMKKKKKEFAKAKVLYKPNHKEMSANQIPQIVAQQHSLMSGKEIKLWDKNLCFCVHV